MHPECIFIIQVDFSRWKYIYRTQQRTCNALTDTYISAIRTILCVCKVGGGGGCLDSAVGRSDG